MEEVQGLSKLEKEWIVLNTLRKKWKVEFDDVHLSNGTFYLWPESIGYTINYPTRYTHIHWLHKNILNNMYKEWVQTETFLTQFQYFKRDLSLARNEIPLPYMTIFTLALQFTNYFQDIPMTFSGASSYNVFNIEGNVECISSVGKQYLSAFSSYKDCLMYISKKYSLTTDEGESFKTLYTKFNFSLAMYRNTYLVLLNVLKEVKKDISNISLDHNGNFRKDRKVGNVFCTEYRYLFGEYSTSRKQN